MSQIARIGNSTLDLVVRRLREFAYDIGIEGRPVTYVLVGDSLVPRDRAETRPGLLFRQINRNRRLVEVQLPFAARIILVKSNARVVGLASRARTSAKVFLKNWRRAMIGETRLRNIARSYCSRVGIGVPEVRESDWRQGWLTEDLIAGAMPDAPDFAAFLTTAYTDFLRQTARLRPIGRSAFARRAFQILIEDFGDQAGYLGVSDETLVPVGLAHNDTEASNVLRDWAGRFWLVDWEAAGPYPVCYDYARLFASNPAVGDELLACLRSFDDSGEAAQAELQLAAATAHIIRRYTPLAERAAPAIKALLRPRRR